ncbi:MULTISPECIES: MerR family transcriptional regulator [Brevibacillus]|uniref:MerR family transcriptional regulator n=1 Tax=Brevibacillus TaxID=55080 RepID=UPI001C8E00F3|nr:MULTISPECIES: MerR family transcriptional regulator [Brevibacillus]MBY0088083.1 MerR family transcriptional regulator [Brevibacillus brevis]MCE0450842.1 MerR family transcriptional regulator [Brevibacillus sp. AF8]MCM3145328.1 MerR family transcriptional regulator [Brevibacillus sp. MER 51]
MDVQVWMASKEVADRLDVHVRTLRNWLDLFVPAQERLKNPQGHYLISEAGFELLKEVKERKDNGNSSLKDIQRQLIEEGRLSEEMLMEEELTGAEETAVTLSASNKLGTGMREVEMTVHETLVQFQQELTQLSAMNHMQSTILQKIADIEEMQESLRLEMRRVTFELDLMQQRLTRRKERYARYEPRWSLNPFRWFTRSDRAAEQ